MKCKQYFLYLLLQIWIYAHHPYYSGIVHFISPLLIILFEMWVHMTRLEDNGQPLQVGNQLMIKMFQRGNRRINITQKSHKMKKCLTQIQSNKLVSIKLSFSMSIQGGLPFVVKCMLLQIFFEIWTYLEISKPYLYSHLINW